MRLGWDLGIPQTLFTDKYLNRKGLQTHGCTCSFTLHLNCDLHYIHMRKRHKLTSIFTCTVLSLLARQVPSSGARFYSTAQTEPRDKRKLWLLIIPVTTFFLGTWQIFRLQWKLGLIDELEKKTMASPIDMPSK